MDITMHLGSSVTAYQAALERAASSKLVERIWQRDHTVWNPSPSEISNRLGWLDIAERMQPEAAALTLYARQLQSEGITHALLLGMGGSSLAPEVYSLLLGGQGGVKLGVVDSTDPDYIRTFAAAYDPAHSVYIVSTKSGGTVETLSLFKYFYNQVLSSLRRLPSESWADEAIPNPDAALAKQAGRHFIAITDPGSSLAALAEQYHFRSTFLADANIGGRYSALSHFGLVPAALLTIDLGRLLAQAQRSAANCQVPDASNPGLQLGIAMGVLAQAGRDKLTFISSPSLQPFGDWAEQLIAESTGKHGQGILPVVAEPLGSASEYDDDRVFVALGEQAGEAAERIAQLRSAGHPVIEVSWDDDYSLGAQYFLWEFATAVAGHVLGIQPYDQPDVESAKVQGRAFVDEYSRTGTLPAGQQQTLNAETLRAALAQAKPGDYIALQAYAALGAALTNALQALRGHILSTQRVASTLGYGPRFLHSTGQLHKGDGGHGVFIQFVSQPPAEDLPIPDAAGKAASSLSFGVLKAAQALGDAAALRAAGRRVTSFVVTGDLAEQLNSILKDWA
ncbi:MAG TPA: hypothetical protein PLC52_08635 [Anaerolineales bacterium]|nr:hypothetical protein [Anaerolineales bacterium]HRQ92915.1 hypothetical protein [Anaerolineales bacterium]